MAWEDMTLDEFIDRDCVCGCGVKAMQVADTVWECPYCGSIIYFNDDGSLCTDAPYDPEDDY